MRSAVLIVLLSGCGGGVPFEFYDRDGDGHGTIEAAGEEACAGRCDDCDDADPEVNPLADEACGDAVDNNCDGLVDDVGAGSATFYVDADGDGFGGEESAEACSVPDGYADNADDCDDSDGSVNPTADDVCNGVDDDCNGSIDAGQTATTWYADTDGDGFGDADAAVEACDQPAGHVATATDCDDSSAAIKPGASDDDCDGVDDDCDGTPDGGLVATAWYADTDGDGFGDSDASLQDCTQPSGHVADDGDCDDADAGTYPGADEQCDLADNDCDGTVDDGVVDQDWYLDADGDGFGVTVDVVTDCAQPSGRVAQDGDCDDASAAVNPGEPESCNEVDDNCDGAADEGLPESNWYPDADGDGFGDAAAAAVSACGAPANHVDEATDCDDTSADVSPAEPEVCDNGVDDDCDPVDGCAFRGAVNILDASSVDYQTPYPPLGIAVGEMSGDQFADIAIVFGPFVGIVEGPGIGSLAAELSVSAEDASVGDLDGDGIAEVVTMGTETAIFRGGQLSGVLSPPAAVARISGSGSVLLGAVGNVDDSGAADLVLVEALDETVAVFLSEPVGNQSFGDADAALTGVVSSGAFLAGGAFGDGSVYLPTTDGGYLVGHPGGPVLGAEPQLTGFPSSQQSLLNRRADFDDDGTDDLALGSYGPSVAETVFVMNGPVTAGDIPSRATAFLSTDAGDSEFAKAIAAVDLNGDGIDDLAISEPGSISMTTFKGRVYVFYGPIPTSDTNVDDADLILEGTTGHLGSHLDSGDVNGDGIEDLVITDKDISTVYVVHGSGI